MMDDLELRIRDTLRQRHGDIATAPALDLAPPRRPRRWIVVAAAAAVVLLVAGIVLVLRGTGRDDSARPASCLTGLPSAWRSDTETPLVSYPATPLGILDDGTLLVQAGSADSGPIEAVRPGERPRDILVFPTDTFYGVRVYPIGGARFVLVLSDTGQGMIAPTGPRPTGIAAIYVVDAASGDRVPVTDDPDLTIRDAAVLDGKIYWDDHPDPASDLGSIKRYDIAARATTTVFTGHIPDLIATATYVAFGTERVAADLPADVLQALGDDAITDGTAYAAASSDTVTWADRDGTIRGPLDPDGVNTVQLQAVAGPYVFMTSYDVSDEIFVLDTRTGASADTGLQSSGVAIAGSGVVAFGGTVDSTTGPPPIRRIDTNDLPGLHC